MDVELQEKDAWVTLRPNLRNTYDYNAYWEQAIQLFSTRFNRKFLNPIQRIIDLRNLEGEGFSVLTIQCAIIEALAAFKAGKIYNYRMSTPSPNFEYSDSRALFVEFLNGAHIFENNFFIKDASGQTINNTPFSADSFYADVRCGLMHEARTKNNWIITATNRSVKTDTVFLERRGNKIAILRTILHYRIKEYVSNYSDDLRSNGDYHNRLRRFLGRKLDHLFDISPDPINYDWWTND